MIFYWIFAVLIALQQVSTLYLTWRHSRYILRKHQPKPLNNVPKVAIIAPYKGFDTTFEQNVDSLFQLDYPDYEIFFVVESDQDPVYEKLQQRIDAHQQTHPKIKAHLLIAGITQNRSQKVHNSLAACRQLPDDIEAIAFVDSDVCVKPNWLAGLIKPLRRSKIGASTGYRIYIPTDSRLSTLALSAINTNLAFFLGPHRFNATWGGTMAISRDIFHQADVPGAWENACTDDYSLTAAVRNIKRRIAFVPACLVPSHEQMSWSQMFAFARRQFIITRVYTRGLWWFAFVGMILYVLSFWASLATAMVLLLLDSPDALSVAIFPAAIYLGSIIKGLIRRHTLHKIMPDERRKLRLPALLDIFAQPLFSCFTAVALIASACSRKITWRGFRYHLHSPRQTEIVPLS